MTDRNTAELRQHMAKEDAQEAKWQAYKERAKQILVGEFFQHTLSGPISVDALLEEYFDDPVEAILDNGDYQEYREAVALWDWDNVGRIMGRAFERIAFKLAESETFADRLAEIVNELDEDSRNV